MADRLLAFAAPRTSPSLRGGTLLYGPPGCGKTYLAEATAGALGARLLSAPAAQTGEHVAALFEAARGEVPCVLFFDELDAIGRRPGEHRVCPATDDVDQLRGELDRDDNAGVVVLAATNHPWDVDPALLRPGRFDRTLAVLPPAARTRATILEQHLRERPVGDVELSELVRRTEGLSGRDLVQLCESAGERASLHSPGTGRHSRESGRCPAIGMADLLDALDEIETPTAAWFASARNVVRYANQDGTYDDLMAYLATRNML